MRAKQQSRVASKIAGGRLTEVAADGLVFRLRRVVSRDLVDRGYALVLAVAPKDGGPISQIEAIKALRSSSEYLAALVVASVVAIRADEDGAEWETWQVVGEDGAEDLDGGAIWIGSLPPGAIGPVADAALAHSGGGQGAAALPAFLRAGAATHRSTG